MARFQFHRRPVSWFAARREPTPVETVRTVLDDTAPRGPGWFESSWELVRGLVVHEGLPSHPGLDEWLCAYLCEVTVPVGPPEPLQVLRTG